MSKIHIEGWANKLDLADKLTDNNVIPNDFGTDEDVFESTLEFIPNVSLRIYASDTKKTIAKAQEDHLREILGDVTVEGSLNGYSEYTIMGWDLERMWIGGHDIQNIINQYGHKYLHLLFDWSDDHERP